MNVDLASGMLEELDSGGWPVQSQARLSPEAAPSTRRLGGNIAMRSLAGRLDRQNDPTLRRYSPNAPLVRRRVQGSFDFAETSLREVPAALRMTDIVVTVRRMTDRIAFRLNCFPPSG